MPYRQGNLMQVLPALARDSVVKVFCLFLLAPLLALLASYVGLSFVLRQAVTLVPFLFVIWALLYRRGDTDSPIERRFWHWITAATTLLFLAACQLSLPSISWVMYEIFLLFVYVSLIFAAEMRPDRSVEASRLGRRERIESVAFAAFVVGLLSYFLLTSMEFKSGAFQERAAYLNLVLDLYLLVRLGHLSWRSDRRRWKWTYALLAVVALIWAAADLWFQADGLEHSRLAAAPLPKDLLWLMTLFALILALRLGKVYAAEEEPVATPRRPLSGQGQSRYWVPLLFYTLLLPVVHLFLSSLDLLSSDLERARDVFVLGYLVLLGLLVLLQHKVQQVESRVLETRRREAMEAKELADAANAAKSQFLAEMSHDIRTPMNGILGVTRLLIKGGLPPREGQYVQIVKQSAEGLLQLMDDILDLSKIEAGRLSLEELDFRARDTVSEVVELLAPRTTGHGVSLRFEVADSVPLWVRGDPGRLRQVLYNLVGNAIKFTPQGSVLVRAEGGTDPGTGKGPGESVPVRFLVRDTGIGIPEEVRARLFVPFTSSGRRSGGSGLGLANCKKLVEAMGGELQVESTPGLGSTFWFTVAFKPALRRWEMTVAPAAVEKERQEMRRKHRILVAEDEWVNRLIVERVLEDLGYQAETVTNGYEVLDALDRTHFDLVLMDCQMPEMDGYEATRQIRARQTKDRNCPVIALTAAAMKEEEERCRTAGMDDFIAKPYREEELAAVLDHWLAVKTRVRQPAPAPASARPAKDTRALNPGYVDELRKLKPTAGQDLLSQLAEEFLHQAPRAMEQVERALDQGDSGELAAVLHRLTGSVGALGAFQLSQVCKNLQQLAIEGRLSECADSISELKREYGRVEAELREIVASSREVEPVSIEPTTRVAPGSGKK